MTIDQLRCAREYAAEQHSRATQRAQEILRNARNDARLPPEYPAAAIANAVYDALGVRVRSLPLTVERLIAGMPDLRARARRPHDQCAG